MKQTYKLETITPIHIGSGETFNHIDGYYDKNKWHRIDLDKVLAHPNVDINALTSEMSQRNFRWSDYFSRHNMNAADLSTYSLLCAQSPKTTDIREAIKSVGNRPYIPGSSIKGAIRTALLSYVINKDDELFENGLDYLKNITKQRGRGNPRRETPAQKIEKDAFGKDPNHDLFRALQVSDTETLTSDALEIGKIDNGREYKNYVEQIQEKQTFTFTLKIDKLLFRNKEKERLGFSQHQEEMLKDIAEICRSETHAYMKNEQVFFDDYSFPEIVNLYDKLIQKNTKLLEGEFLLQIGWGTGYNANTVTASLVNYSEEPDELWLDLRKRFRLGTSRSRHGHYDKREFPKTRRILYRGENPIAPLGWVKISPIQN